MARKVVTKKGLTAQEIRARVVANAEKVGAEAFKPTAMAIAFVMASL